MKLLVALYLIVGIGLFTGCKVRTETNDPKAVLEAFMNALSKKDFAAARELSTAKSQTLITMMETATQSGEKSERSFSKYDNLKLEFSNANIQGDLAIVPVKERNTGETLNYNLKKEQGAWKVAFDPASLMGIMTEKMVEKGLNPTSAIDSLGNGMDKLKSVSIDSLKKSMEGGMKAFDSVTKELKKIH